VKIHRGIEQGTPEWLELRMGRSTGSRYKDVLAGGQGATRRSYMVELAAEVLTSAPQPTFSNEAMRWGTETEPQARSMYELNNGVEVEQVSFVSHESINTGVSPDGFPGSDGLVEFKCPNTKTQIETFLKGDMPTGHKAQVQGQMWVAEREWCDFVSFDPRIIGDAGYFQKRIYRDEKYIKELEEKLKIFDEELQELILKLRGSKT
jgi:putative phage-type endonuclease